MSLRVKPKRSYSTIAIGILTLLLNKGIAQKVIVRNAVVVLIEVLAMPLTVNRYIKTR